jgi:lipoate-protein ligase A
MEKDTILLETLNPAQEPILHLYEWKSPSITYGHFIKVDQILNLQATDDLKIEVAKRPTGGGVIIHLFDLAFSFLLPSSHPSFSLNTLENYHTVNHLVQKAILPFVSEKSPELLKVDPIDDSVGKHFCMAKPTIYDVVIGDKKVAGSAQRRKAQGFLHQGSIAISPPDLSILRSILKGPDLLIPKMENNSFSMIEAYSLELIVEKRRAIELALQKEFSLFFK